MAFSYLAFLIVILFVVSSQEQSNDPIQNFCRRWSHQTATIDGKLYIDGGLVTWDSQTSYPLNYTNTWLTYADLDRTTNANMPQPHANLTKPGNVPGVLGGVLWADEVNKCFYLYGGEFQDVPQDFAFWKYDTLLNQWNATKYESNQIVQRASYGAGTQAEERGLGYYFGGYQDWRTSLGLDGTWSRIATNNMVTFDFTNSRFTIRPGPDSIGRAEGAMVYLPASNGGLLIYFGGVEDQEQNGTVTAANMSTIHVYDVIAERWYKQAAVGTVPEARRQFCAGASWADDRSSYNIYLFGGFSADPGNGTALDDVYILSLPSFTWIKAWPLDNKTTTVNGHGGCSANVINRAQMLIIGGWFPGHDRCDQPWGMHNLNLGYGGSTPLWAEYKPGVSVYEVPSPVVSVVGGGPTGGATVTKPATWDGPDLSVLFTLTPTATAARTATRTIPSATATPGPDSKKTNIGAIAGAVVGGVAAFAILLALVLFWLSRREKAQKNKNVSSSPATPPPVELGTASPIHEMHSPGAAKHLDMRTQDANAYPMNPGVSLHSRSLSDQYLHSSPYAPHSATSSTPSPHPSPYPQFSPSQQAYSQQPPYTAYTDTRAPAYHPHPTTHNAQYPSYPQAISSSSSPNFPPPLPQQQYPYPQPPPQQTYYPPPPDPALPAFSDRSPSSPTGTQYSGDTRLGAPSASHTPAHFYGGNLRGDGRGRFVEGDGEM
ncbi:hypothetical protein M011DRAFT_405844 [Sporormia fimetaria CBS 119925]|uniref:Galactose oxidase n=1 Tax=Sporormia fimetaria CBS 119925 TaxID=1340428 RepID=A0A6A6V6E6_9PLEO|nr:hypothetical protein M011DRAFT_405844 [Sporormia fimetaria CBS 119925]